MNLGTGGSNPNQISGGGLHPNWMRPRQANMFWADAGDDFKSIQKDALLNFRDTTDSLARRTTCFGSLQIVGIRWHLWICDDMCGQFAEGMSPSTFYLQPGLNRSQPLRQGNQFPP